MLEKGTLYVCGTPIGNLGDITLRVLDTLREVDLIAAEDTRHSRKLMQHFQITTPLTSYHEHNERKKSSELVERLKAGQAVALISDAGLPGISDPGSEVIRLCIEENIPVDVLPGPNAALTALILSGMPAEHFTFYGFLPTAAGARKRILEDLATRQETLILYEAPHRLLSTLQGLCEVFGSREAAVVRELTKVHQQVHKNSLIKLREEFEETPPRGECCLVIAPFIPEKLVGGPQDWIVEVNAGVQRGLSKKDAMKEVAKRYGVKKSDVYQALIEE
ncbi:putative S-adenosylmethionine-dependent methyltransferase, YraL family [Desulfosporosinus acidiphilus SJ4]|uniref:Ribosomal RNA small subunit methyltransferase I n=1 Tax=Desulfosporosinus acidiphilus (strain DSM 22704 / JCM 16185 / SJ4) TaxID=646529 RepID=I4D025_DESAJ|nr:16S rRNA (cytidine(1402)-2'-O)-methyltransferase [Desulfosporosinus acidiphilus]AFM39149.1 putative S-adenosylmethionine-dependent methyltransferase, YraL family [Desulfosporosinus acidiphilus SJ4]